MEERDGLVLLDKPSGITSHDAVAIFRRASGIRRTGHTGTLDPLATGLLVLCAGRATRLQAFLTGMPKEYTGEIQFGWATETYDAEGEPVGEASPVDVERAQLEEIIARELTGEIAQVPPAYSAKKVEGRRAYELARKGKAPNLEPRRVKIDSFHIESVDGSVARFFVRCSAGTYVRSLAHDLGRAVGCGAFLRSLRRTAVGDFDVAKALSIEALREMPRDSIFAAPHFVPMGRVELPLERVLIDPAQESKLLSGQAVIVRAEAGLATGDEVAVTNLSMELVAIGEAIDVRESGPVLIQPRVVLKG